MKEGFYEKIITRALQSEINALENKLVSREAFNKRDGAIYLNRFFQSLIQRAFEQVMSERDEQAKEKIISLSNELIRLISTHLDQAEILEEQIEASGEVLKAFFHKPFFSGASLEDQLKETYPFTGLSESELFTGSKKGISLESELKKEMLTSDEVWWLVSFVKFEGVRLFEQVFRKLEAQNKPIKIICTVYMGATDLRAIDFLSQFSNIEIKISYNTNQERLHAKSYLFLRESGFHTGYIGSSNMSRSALTNGLEWNLKITQQEIPHIINKCRSTFETYWNDKNFELYNQELHRDKLADALSNTASKGRNLEEAGFFDLYPFPFQQEILDQLSNCRNKGESRNLIVAATGTGKTVISAFDFKRYRKEKPDARFLFTAHRAEILNQARFTFRQVLKNNDFGDLWYSGQEPKSYHQLFVSIQTLNNRIDSLNLADDFYDFIIIDEVHHSAAPSYKKLLERFEPKILVGLSATPERLDGQDISAYFGNSISAEIRLPEALNRGLLCPFQYFGITDQVDISRVSWRRGRYDISELDKVYCEDDRRVLDILRNCEKYLKDIREVRALGFCVNKRHAEFMTEHFMAKGLKAKVLTSDNSHETGVLKNQLVSKEINYLFVVDIFNEGIDIPEIDTLLFLRPTESLTIFLQQLGRGLRLHEDKTCLTVLDFVGQQHAEYSFEHKFRGMLGKTHTRIKDEIENDFPHLPIGCSITLEQTAREVILNNLTRTYRGGIKSLLTAIARFRSEYSLPITLKNFCEYGGSDLRRIYDTRLLWCELLERADGKQEKLGNHKHLAQVMGNAWLATDSLSYFGFLKNYLETGVLETGNPIALQHMLMLYIDIFVKAPVVPDGKTLKSSLEQIFSEPVVKSEVIEYLDYRMEKLECIEKPIVLRLPSALKLHGRYTRNQVLTGFGINTLSHRSISQSGVYPVKELNSEILFVTLDKSEGKFNPSTMYHDYFISEELFHWQSQNSTSPESPVGQSYIHQVARKKEILLFVREATQDENGLTMAFIFCGKVHYVHHTGSKPMSITWRMEHQPPPSLFNEGRKLAIG